MQGNVTSINRFQHELSEFRMNKFMLFLAAIMLVAVCHSYASEVPEVISYQGQLNDDSGVPIDGSVDMTFSLYDVDVGGAALWTESQPVGVVNGIFNVKLGEMIPLQASFFNQPDLYLGITVETDAEMAPRQKLSTSSFAMNTPAGQFPVPIGSIMAWAKNISGVPTLSDGWVECNGQVLADPLSPLDGQTMPDLNGASGDPRFLRGSSASGSTGGSEDHTHTLSAHAFTNTSAGGSSNSWVNFDNTVGETSTLPSYYSVVWIMKVRED